MTDPTSHNSLSERDDDREDASRDSYPPEPVTPRLRFYLHGREITAEEAANAPTLDPPEMERRVIDGAIGTRCLR